MFPFYSLLLTFILLLLFLVNTTYHHKTMTVVLFVVKEWGNGLHLLDWVHAVSVQRALEPHVVVTVSSLAHWEKVPCISCVLPSKFLWVQIFENKIPCVKTCDGSCLHGVVLVVHLSRIHHDWDKLPQENLMTDSVSGIYTYVKSNNWLNHWTLQSIDDINLIALLNLHYSFNQGAAERVA